MEVNIEIKSDELWLFMQEIILEKIVGNAGFDHNEGFLLFPTKRLSPFQDVTFLFSEIFKAAPEIQSNK